MEPDLVCFGELLWDIYEGQHEDQEEKIGGAPFNVAALASLSGISATLITAVGRDERGKKIRAVAGKKVNLLYQVNEHKTGIARVILEAGNPKFSIEKDVAYDYIIFDDTIRSACTHAKFLYFGTLAQRNDVSRKTLRDILTITHAVRIYDFNYREGIDEWKTLFRESIEKTDILKVNEEEMELLKSLYRKESDETLTDTLIQQYRLKYVFVTRGGKGASLYSKNKVLHKGALKCNVVDTTGCGDAFTAGIVYSLLNGFDDEKILETAIKFATGIAEVKGAVPDNGL